jgi:hypothetical protein
VLGYAAALARLEAIVHPLVQDAEGRLLAQAQARGEKVAVLDIPLLFETGGDRRVDAVVVVTAPPEVQRARALARPGMTIEKVDAILSKQCRMRKSAAPISSIPRKVRCRPRWCADLAAAAKTQAATAVFTTFPEEGREDNGELCSTPK